MAGIEFCNYFHIIVKMYRGKKTNRSTKQVLWIRIEQLAGR